MNHDQDQQARKGRRFVNRSGDLARLHILKKELRLEDDAYRELLAMLTNGKRSAADMDATERARVVAHFESLKRAYRAAKPDGAPQRTRVRLTPIQAKVYALWKTLDNAGVLRSSEERSLRAYIRRQVQVDALEFCGPEHCRQLIESLKQWCARLGVEVRK